VTTQLQLINIIIITYTAGWTILKEEQWLRLLASTLGPKSEEVKGDLKKSI
jgi:hypothetical protein